MLYIADPSAPVELANYSPPGDILDLCAVDSLLYISDGDAGLRIVENQLFLEPGGGVGWAELNSGTGEDLRCVFFIDPKRLVRTMIYYPLNVGRNFDEIVRVVDALQTADANGIVD